MNILLFNPSLKIRISKNKERYFVRAGSRWPFSTEKYIYEKPLYVPFPFYLGYAASILSSVGIKVKVLDAVALDLTQQQMIEKIKSKFPDVIVLETTDISFEYDIQLVRKLKQIFKNLKVVFTGTYATAFAYEIISKYNEIDFVIAGEYEIALKDLILNLGRLKFLEEYKGIYWRNNNQIFGRDFTEIIDPLDQLPPPARNLFPDDESPNINIYKDAFCSYFPSIQLHLSRGCPYRCYFCLWNQIMYRNKQYRTFSIERAIGEIEDVILKFKPKELYFDDDDFTVDRNYVISICKEIIKRKLNIKWSCMGNAMHLDEEVIFWMAKSGCIGIKFGVESGDKELTKTIGKPMDLDKVRYVVNLLTKYGIKTHATFSFGLLGETKLSMYNTLRYAIELPTDTVQFSICTPYPKTKFFKILEKKGYIKDFNLNKLDGSCRCVYEYPNISSKYIESFFKSVYKRWLIKKLLTPLWVIRWIKRIVKIILFGGKESRKVLFKVLYKVFTKWI